MSEKITKLTRIFLWVLIALSAFFGLMVFLNLDDSRMIDNALIYAEVMLYIAIGAAVLSSIYIFILKLIEKPKKTYKSILMIVVLVIVLLLAFTVSSDEVLNMPNYEGSDNNPSTVKWTGTGILIMYILLGIAILSILFVEIKRLFK